MNETNNNNNNQRRRFQPQNGNMMPVNNVNPMLMQGQGPSFRYDDGGMDYAELRRQARHLNNAIHQGQMNAEELPPDGTQPSVNISEMQEMGLETPVPADIRRALEQWEKMYEKTS